MPQERDSVDSPHAPPPQPHKHHRPPQFKDFDAACSKGNLVNQYEWGFGPCDDYMTAVKANAGQTSFTATVRACVTPVNPKFDPTLP